jgi:hypothetical protein
LTGDFALLAADQGRLFLVLRVGPVASNSI